MTPIDTHVLLGSNRVQLPDQLSFQPDRLRAARGDPFRISGFTISGSVGAARRGTARNPRTPPWGTPLIGCPVTRPGDGVPSETGAVANV